jgi:geranylgeranyl diphosphate synthase type II
MNRELYRREYDRYRRVVERRLHALARARAGGDVDEACRYVLTGGGKRIRAIITILSCQAAGGSARAALDAGSAIEIMHNFTLVHDDIMDNAPSRRGRPSVHVRWDVNNALLAGDVLLGLAYQALLRTKTRSLGRIVELFTRGLLDVCQGQSLDLEYERRTDVTVEDYFRMIEKKTGRLLSTAAEIGAVIGGGTPRTVAALSSYGRYVGRAFQLEDDLLDAIGSEAELGKAVGGDILERKKTYLLLETLRRARGRERAFLRTLLVKEGPRAHKGRRSPAEKRLIGRVRALYDRHGVLDDTRRLIGENTDRAVAALATLRASRASALLRSLAEELIGRSS